MTNRKRSAWPWIVGPFLAVVLYVLSVGPEERLRLRYAKEWDPYKSIYWPIEWVCNRSRTLEDAICWYLQLWISDHRVWSHNDIIEDTSYGGISSPRATPLS